MILSKSFKNGQWPLLLLSPALCFISSVSRIKRGEVKASWTIPFIMGLIAYLYPPYADFARTENGIIELLDYPLSTVIALRGDIILTTFEYFFLKNGIPIEIFRFFYTYIGYYYITKVFEDITKKKTLSHRTIFNIWLFLFLLVEFFGFIDNVRTIFVRIMLLYCMYQYYFNNKNRYRYYALLLIPVHFAYFPILLLFFFSKYLSFDFSKSVRFIIIILLLFSDFFLDHFNLISLFSRVNMGDVLNNRILAYTEGEWASGGENLNSYSFAYKVYITLISLSKYYLMLLFCKAHYRHSIERFIIVLGIVCLLTSSVPVLFGRYMGFFTFSISLYVLYGYSNGFIKQTQMTAYLFLCCFNISLDIYAYWNSLVNGNVIYILLPLPLALFQTYNFIEWRDGHLSDDFNTIVNGGFLSR